VFFNLRVKPIPLFEVAVQGLVGTGTGRYGSSQLADATLKPNEQLEPIRNDHGLFSLIFHPSKNWDFFSYYGGEYAQRTVYDVVTPTGLAPIGLLQPAGSERQRQRYRRVHLGDQLRFADALHPGSYGWVHLARGQQPHVWPPAVLGYL
jgi:hypothetical protein